MGVFCDDDGVVGSRDAQWIQHLINVMFCLFRQYYLVVNISKSRTMTCQSGALRFGLSVEFKAQKCTGVGDAY